MQIKIASQIIEKDAGFLKQNLATIIEETKKLFTSAQKWRLNRQKHGSQTLYMMRVLATQIEFYPNYNVIFPQWLDFKQMFMRVCKISNIKKLENSVGQKSYDINQAKRRNQLLKDYQNKYKYVDPIMMVEGAPQSISKFISKNFPKTKGWRQIFSCLQRDLRAQDEQIYLTKYIHEERPMPKNFLCCSQFLYQGVNCYNPQIDCIYQVDYIEDSQKSSQIEIKQKVISLLNCNGGILFFDVYPKLTELIVEGKFLTQQNKEQTLCRINSCLKSVSPKININQHYTFKWIPIIENPTRFLSTEKQTEKDQYRARKFKTGMWVLMMIITPSNPYLTYHYTINNTSFVVCRDNRQTKNQLQAKQVYQFIKNRFTNNYGKKGFDHSHCLYPLTETLKGKQVFGEEEQRKQNKCNNDEIQKFKYHSLVIVDRTNRQKVQNVLNKQKIEHLIEQAFPQYNFRLTSNTWILHHNVKFDRIKILINQNNLRYLNNSKCVIPISTTKSLQTSFIDQAGISNLNAWIRGIYPQQNITFERSQHEFFLSTKTIMGCIYMYMLLDNFQIRARFRKPPLDKKSMPDAIKAYMS